jgi:hypothetical protein
MCDLRIAQDPYTPGASALFLQLHGENSNSYDWIYVFNREVRYRVDSTRVLKNAKIMGSMWRLQFSTKLFARCEEEYKKDEVHWLKNVVRHLRDSSEYPNIVNPELRNEDRDVAGT